MNSRIPWHYAALLGASTLVVGCGPDASERAADRDPEDSIRPPTTITPPAAPGAAAPPAVTPRLMARAEVRPLEDNTARGVVEFQTAAGGTGPLTIHVSLMGLDAGPHGMHVHDGADCTAPGTHLNPLNAPHGAANAGADARHLGDLGNITADASGMVEEMLRDTQLGSDSTFVGKVIVVHRGLDDLSTQPDGGSGEPIACGVIEPADEDLLSSSESLDRGA
jgi:Cu-Zn family superoxide dismutase